MKALKVSEAFRARKNRKVSNMRGSIRQRLTLAFIALTVIPLVLIGGVLAWQSFTQQGQQALDLQNEMAQRVSTQVMAFFGEVENEMLLTSHVQGLSRLDQDKQRSVLSELLAYHDVFEELALLDSQGQEHVRIVRTGLVSELRNRSQDDEFTATQTSGQTYYSPIRFDEVTSEPFMTIAVPLLNVRTGTADWVLVAEVRVKKIWDLIANLQVGSDQNVYIIDAQGKVVAHRNPSVVLQGTNFHAINQNGIQPGLASVNPMLAVDDTRGGLSIQGLVDRLTSPNVVLAMDTVRLGEQEFNIIAEQPIAVSLALAINTIIITAGLIVAGLIVSVTLGLLIVRQIVGPIQTLAATAQDISAGDLSKQVPVTRQDELGILAGAFNSMTGQLRTLINSLEQRVADRTHRLEIVASIG